MGGRKSVGWSGGWRILSFTRGGQEARDYKGVRENLVGSKIGFEGSLAASGRAPPVAGLWPSACTGQARAASAAAAFGPARQAMQAKCHDAPGRRASAPCHRQASSTTLTRPSPYPPALCPPQPLLSEPRPQPPAISITGSSSSTSCLHLPFAHPLHRSFSLISLGPPLPVFRRRPSPRKSALRSSTSSRHTPIFVA
jgi:hypothetical protein